MLIVVNPRVVGGYAGIWMAAIAGDGCLPDRTTTFHGVV